MGELSQSESIRKKTSHIGHLKSFTKYKQKFKCKTHFLKLNISLVIYISIPLKFLRRCIEKFKNFIMEISQVMDKGLIETEHSLKTCSNSFAR